MHQGQPISRSLYMGQAHSCACVSPASPHIASESRTGRQRKETRLFLNQHFSKSICTNIYFTQFLRIQCDICDKNNMNAENRRKYFSSRSISLSEPSQRMICCGEIKSVLSRHFPSAGHSVAVKFIPGCELSFPIFWHLSVWTWGSKYIPSLCAVRWGWATRTATGSQRASERTASLR